MNTEFQEVYDIFLSKITDFDYLNLVESDLQEELLQKLKSATATFFGSDIRLNIDMEIFNKELDGIEQEILAYGILYEWLSPTVFSIENTKQYINSSDWKIYSQANHLDELRLLLKDVEKKRDYLMRRYKLEKKKKELEES